MALNKQEIRRFRSIGHHLKPVVSFGSKGLSEGLIEELERALEDHELIKVKLHVEDRADKKPAAEALCKETGAEIVQMIGKIALVYRAAKRPNAKLSNVLRNSEV